MADSVTLTVAREDARRLLADLQTIRNTPNDARPFADAIKGLQGARRVRQQLASIVDASDEPLVLSGSPKHSLVGFAFSFPNGDWWAHLRTDDGRWFDLPMLPLDDE